jgi:hypothetical protein
VVANHPDKDQIKMLDSKSQPTPPITWPMNIPTDWQAITFDAFDKT